MNVVFCNQCRKLIQIGGDPLEVKGLLGQQDSFPCVTPLCGGRMLKLRPDVHIENYEITEMPVKNFFRGIHGFGSGVGAPASLARARELLLNEKIVEVIGESVGQPERVILRCLVLRNGTRLHFDTSSKGACLYYIEEPGPSCVEVVEDELSSGTTSEGGDSDREEAGRSAEAVAVSGSDPEQVAGAPDAPAVEQPEPGGVPLVPEAGGVPEDADPRGTGDGDHPNLRM